MTHVIKTRSVGTGLGHIQLALLVLVIGVFGTASASAEELDGWTPPPMPEPQAFAEVNLDEETIAKLEEEWGVQVLGIKVTAAGMMLDFRFRVVDAEKAISLFDHRIKPYIVAERTKIKLPVPMAAKVGAFRPTNRGRNIRAGRNYYMIFGNPDRHVSSGEKVSIYIGDFVVENLTVS